MNLAIAGVADTGQLAGTSDFTVWNGLAMITGGKHEIRYGL
jgi:hypothetical protein